VYLAWCTEHDLKQLTAQRADLERYIRWMQGTRRFKPSTVSRRISVLAGFYRTRVIDGLWGFIIRVWPVTGRLRLAVGGQAA
jgi:integrase/recombinase XerD